MVFEKKGKQKAKKAEATPRRPTSRSGGCMFLNPLGSSCDASGEMKWDFQGEKSRPLLALSPSPREWDAVGEDHTSLTSIYHFVRESPTTQETIKHCERPRYQTPQ